MNCNASRLTSPATPSQVNHGHPISAPPGPLRTTQQDEPGQPAAGQPLQAFPSEQHQNRTASLIGKNNRNPKRHKKILAQKALDKVYIYYQSAMTPT
jgi:hypothetical protein